LSNFIDKLQFWKRHEDFSFNDTSNSFSNTADATDFSTGLPPLDASANNPSALSQDSFGDPSAQSSFDPLSASSADSTSFASPASSHPSSSSNSMDSSAPQKAQASSPPLGKQLARDYIGQKDPLQPSWSGQTTQQTQNKTSSFSNEQSMEVVQLKLDAIRSELNAMSQRMIKIEHLLEQEQKKRTW